MIRIIESNSSISEEIINKATKKRSYENAVIFNFASKILKCSENEIRTCPYDENWLNRIVPEFLNQFPMKTRKLNYEGEKFDQPYWFDPNNGIVCISENTNDTTGEEPYLFNFYVNKKVGERNESTNS